MSSLALAGRSAVRRAADGVLSAAAALWFLVTLAGQWGFFYYIAGFYGVSTLSGDLEVWNRLQALGRTPYVAGDTIGNMAYASHALGAGIIAFGGALQLVPFIRNRFPTFHRWNGRLFLLTATALAFSGFYLVWVRHTSPTFIDGLSTSFNGVLILSFAFLTLRAALARDFESHPRWAMRLWLVSNAQWFLRVGVFAYFVMGQIIGYKASFGDALVRFWTFGCYLVPIAILQLYFMTRGNGGSLERVAMAGLLVLLSGLMTVGIFAYSTFSQALITGAPLALPR